MKKENGYIQSKMHTHVPMHKIIYISVIVFSYASCKSTSPEKNPIINREAAFKKQTDRLLLLVKFEMASDIKRLMDKNVSEASKERIEQSLVFRINTLLIVSKDLEIIDQLRSHEILKSVDPYVDYLLNLDSIGGSNWQNLDGEENIMSDNKTLLEDHKLYIESKLDNPQLRQDSNPQEQKK